MTTSRSDRWRLGPALLALGAAGPLDAQEVTPPSGHAARLFDVVLEADDGTRAPDAGTDPEAAPDGLPLGDEPLDAPAPAASVDPEAAEDEGLAAPPGGVARFRFVVDGLAGLGYEAVAGDFAWLCEQLALPALDANGWTPAEVVVTLADREVTFGASDPDATQFFEGFRVEDGACVALAF